MNHPTTLYTWTEDVVTLTDAMRAVEGVLGSSPIGLFYSLRVCRFGLYRHRAFLDEAGNPLDLSDVYEARVFTTQGELRWWNDPSIGFGTGKSAYLTETNQPPDGWTSASAVWHDVVPWSNCYLLWGAGWTAKQHTLVAGWSCLAAGRIGTLVVPFGGLQPQERLQLTTVEYFGRVPGPAGAHGNMAVVEERLLKLEKYSLPHSKEDTDE